MALYSRIVLCAIKKLLSFTLLESNHVIPSVSVWQLRVAADTAENETAVHLSHLQRLALSFRRLLKTGFFSEYYRKTLKKYAIEYNMHPNLRFLLQCKNL